MSRSFSIRSQAVPVNFAADRPCKPEGISLLVRLRTFLVEVRQRRTETAMAMAGEQLEHPGVIADFQRAAKRSGFAGSALYTRAITIVDCTRPSQAIVGWKIAHSLYYVGPAYQIRDEQGHVGSVLTPPLIV